MVCTLIVLNVHLFMRCRKAWFRAAQGFSATQKPVGGAPPMEVILDAGISVGLAQGSLWAWGWASRLAQLSA